MATNQLVQGAQAASRPWKKCKHSHMPTGEKVEMVVNGLTVKKRTKQNLEENVDWISAMTGKTDQELKDHMAELAASFKAPLKSAIRAKLKTEILALLGQSWKFREMCQFCDTCTKQELGLEVVTHVNEEGLKLGLHPTDNSTKRVSVMKTDALKQALDKHEFDAAFGGARRDEEKSKAKEQVFSFRDTNHCWDPKNQRPELWNLSNTRVNKRESVRMFPLSNWTELDIWQCIHMENVPIVPLHFSAGRPVVERNGVLVMVDDDRLRLEPGEEPLSKVVRFRTLGCYPLTGAVESAATTLPQIIQEMLLATTSELQGCAIDHDEEGSMEKQKIEGHF